MVAVGATAALAVYCFVKVIGLVVLGAPRSDAAAQAHDQPTATRIALVSLAAVCVILGAVPGLIFPTLADLAPGPVTLGTHAGLQLPGTGGLRTLGVLIALSVVGTVVVRATGAARRAPVTPAWTCGQPIERSLAWTSAGFTKPLRLREFELVEAPGGVQRIRYHAEVPHLFDELLYAPVQRRALRAATVARRLQSGNLRTYVLYLLALLLALLALVRFGGLA
jgi:hydrogenase-4 component B